MYKIIIFIIILFNLGCSNTKMKREWTESKYIQYNISNIKIGDIIISKKSRHFLSWYGHCGLVTEGYSVAEISKLGDKLSLSSLYDWNGNGKRIVILRFKDISNEFRYDLVQEINRNMNKPYKIFINKKNNKGFYCSQFIWKIYNEVGKKYGRKIDLDSDGGIFIFPYDILYSQELEEIILEKRKEEYFLF